METLEDFRIEYQGTLAQFKASNYPTTYADKIVHITGDSAGKDSAIFANGKYYAATDAALAALKLFDKVSAGGQTAQAAAAGSTLAFEDGDSITITLTSSGVKFSLSSAFKQLVSSHTTQLEELYERMDAEESATEDFVGNIHDLTQDIVDQESRIKDLETDSFGYNSRLDNLEGDVGNTDDLDTTSKNTVGAINEVLAAVGTGSPNAVVTIDKSTDGLTYTIKQGGNQVGVINIPQDMTERGWRPMRGNGSDIYWNKIASVAPASGGRDAWIEVEVNGDTNYPAACRFIIQITQYNNGAVSVAVFGGASPVPASDRSVLKPCVTVDANRNVWLKILNARWDMYAAIRPLKQDAFGTITILGKAVADGAHASNFETQVAAPASTFLEGYGGLRYTISSGTYTLTGAVIDATATDAKKLGGVDASEYAKTDEIDGQKYVYAQGGLTDDQLIYALPTSKNGTEDDVLVSESRLKTINEESLVGYGDVKVAPAPYTIRSLDITELAVGASFENEIEYIKQAITSGTDIEIYTGNGYGKAKAIYQEWDDYVYLSFCQMASVIYMEIDRQTGEIANLLSAQ